MKTEKTTYYREVGSSFDHFDHMVAMAKASGYTLKKMDAGGLVAHCDSSDRSFVFRDLGHVQDFLVGAK